MRGIGRLVVAFAVAAPALADEAHVAVPLALAAYVETGDRNGHVVGIEASAAGAVVTVSRSFRAFPASPPFPLQLGDGPGDDDYLQIPPQFAVPLEVRRQVARCDRALAVVEQVVAWVTRRITLDESDRGPQDAGAVLARGRGRCSGRANVAVGLLRALGLPARTVHGVLVWDQEARWHRWGEVWLGPLGWVSFDPGAAVGLVSVRYLPMRGAATNLSLAGVRLVHVNERGYAALPRRDGLRVLPAGGATMLCRAPAGTGWITAALLGPDGVRRLKGGSGGVEFRGLLPGRYRLAWEAQGRLEGVVEVWLESRDVVVPLVVSGAGS